MTLTKRLAIVGAGAGGLCAARQALALLRNWVPVVFESMSGVGGTWIYQEEDGSRPTHSSMYKGLRTNLPKEVMAFPDFPFPHSSNSFLSHGEVLAYLQHYASTILQYIQFHTKVVSIVPSGSKWEVETHHLQTNEKSKEHFDAVLVCNGHYSIPSYGEIKDIDLFSGSTLHSHEYRVPQPFTDKDVLVFGGASSGIDIGIEISKYARKVYLSHNNLPYPNLSGIQQVKGLSSCTGEDSFALVDGSIVTNVDVLLYCTGYEFHFPFLHPKCLIRVDSPNRRVRELYKHCINVEHPSMCFVGIPLHICPFPLFDTQIKFFYKTLSGELALPSKDEMLRDIEREFQARVRAGLPPRHIHKFGDYQWEYLRDLASLGGFPGVSRDVQHMYELISKRRRQNILTYRETSFGKHNGELVIVEKGI